MTYTPEQITAHIEHRAHCIGEDSKDVRILLQLLAECDAAWNDAVRAAEKAMREECTVPDGTYDMRIEGEIARAEEATVSVASVAILSLTKDNSHE